MNRKENLPIYQPARTSNLPGYGDGDGGGAGAAGAAGTGPTLEQVNDAINKTVNNAIANLKKTDLPKIVETSITAAMTPMTTQLGTISDALAALTSGSGGGGQGGGQGGSGGGQGGQGTQQQAGVTPEINAQFKTLNDSLKRQSDEVAQLKRERDESNKRAETAEKTSVIKGALGDLVFANAAAMNTAFTIIDPMIKKNGDSFVGGVDGDELPISDFVKDYIPKAHAYLLKATGTSGSGASGAGSSGSGSPSRNVDISAIKPGMKPEDKAAAYAAVAAAYAQTQ